MSDGDGSPRRAIEGALASLVAARTAWRALRGRARGDDAAVQPAPEPTADQPQPVTEQDPTERTVPASRSTETLVAWLLLGTAASAFAFVVLYIVLQFNTQLLGLSFGLALALLAAACIVAGKRMVPQQTSVEERDQLLVPAEAEEVVEIVEEGGEGLSRRGLLVGAGGLAGAALCTAAAAPIASLGPPAHSLHYSPWKRGVRLVDEDGTPYSANQIQIGSWYTALPEGHDPESLGAGVLLVRLPQSMIDQSPSRRDWSPDGIFGYSKICTHAGCAISLYRFPLYGPTSTNRPAFTCPCHYSTFLPGEGGRVLFGPANRPLPQLPLMVDGDGYLVAAGDFDQDVGPSWWGVRRT